MAKSYTTKVGDRFHRWTVIGLERAGQRTVAVCQCDCERGAVKRVHIPHLHLGRSRSCGCLRHKQTTHGMHGTPEYKSWQSMRRRCTDPRRSNYRFYGGRGITVCERWQSFENFVADMGPKPDGGHTIDRIDCNRGYEPGNCRWATWKEQQRNRRNNHRLTIEGVMLTVIEWAEQGNLDPEIVYRRLKRGWLPTDAVTLPSGSRRPNRHHGSAVVRTQDPAAATVAFQASSADNP